MQELARPTCNTCVRMGDCPTEPHARACMSENPHCGYHESQQQMELKL